MIEHGDSGPRCRRCQAPLAAGNLSGRCPRCLAAALASPQNLEVTRAGGGADATARLGPYEILDEVGRGGMGIVYRARHVELDREVALKVMRDADLASSADVDRFRNEAQAAARLAHPGIVRVHDVGEMEGRPYLAMEFIAGRHLGELTRESPLAARTAAELLAAVADAVAHAHDRGVLHRDLKPSNVLVDATGAPHVTDFGLAKRLGPDGGTGGGADLTLTGQVVGTPAYMAPEQASGGRGPLGASVDIYALGALLYHVLTGRPPFLGDGVAEVLHQTLEAVPLSPNLIRPGLPSDLGTICLKCLAKEPAHRYGTARDLAEELRRFLRGEPIRARPAGQVERLWRWARRQPALAGALGFAGVALVAGLVATSVQWRRTQDQLWESQRLRARALRLSREDDGGPLPLDLVTTAAAYRPSFELRNEAIAGLARLQLRELPYRETCEGEMAQFLQPPNYDVSEIDGRLARRGILENGQPGIVVNWPGTTRTPVILFRNGWAGDEVRFSPDGSRLAARYFTNNEVGVWNLAGSNLLWAVPIGPGDNLRLDFSPDGVVLAVASDAEVRMFRVEDGEELPPLRMPEGERVVRAMFAPRPGFMAISTDRRLGLWDWHARRRLASTEFEVAPFAAMDWHPRELEVAMACWRQPEIHLVRFLPRAGAAGGASEERWEARRRVCLEDASSPRLLRYHPSGAYLMARGNDGYTRIFDTQTDRLLLRTHQGLGHRFRADGRVLYHDREAEFVGAWEFVVPTVHRSLQSPGFPDFTSRARFRPDGRAVAWIKGGDARITDLGTAETTYLDRPGVNAIQFEGSDGALRLLTQDGIWRARGDRLESVVAGGNWIDGDATPDGLTWIAVNPDSAWVQRRDGTAAGMPLPFPRDVTNSPSSVAISPDGRWAAYGVFFGRGEVIELAGGRIVHTFPGNPASVAFDARGRWLATGTPAEYCLWEVGSWRRLGHWPRQNPLQERPPLAFSPDGRWLAVSLAPRRVELIDAASGAELARLEPPAPLLVQDVAFDGPGRRLVVASERGILQIWDLEALRSELRALNLDW